MQKEKGMRPGIRVFVLIALTLSIFFPAAFAFADEQTMNLQATILESFDDPTTGLWIVQGSKFITKDFPETTLVRAWPDSLFGKNKEKKDLFALAVHAKFDRKGYNYLEFIPAKKGAGGKLEPTPIPMAGRAQSIDLWVWGSNFNYSMDVHVRDYQGVDHVLKLGSLLFSGWRNLSVIVPSSIPQSRRYIPRFQALELTKIVIWTQPDEKVDDYYVFLDQVKVLTDLFETRFDGDNLADIDILNELWTQGTK